MSRRTSQEPNPVRRALERLHDVVSDIVEDGRLTVGDGADAIPATQYAELVAALEDSLNALETEERAPTKEGD